MKALHRLAGNFPQRGYGLALRTAGFPADSEVFPMEGSRMPGNTMSMPYGRKPVDATNLVEMFHVFEIQPLAYGKLASIFITNCAVKGTRPSGYVDAVYPDSIPADGVTSHTVGLEKMLRFGGFVDSRTFWDMPESVNALEATPWVEDSALSLTFQLPQGWGDKELRALVATVWRTATYRRFGPWAPNNRQKCLYEDDRLLWHIPKMDRSLYAVLGDDTLDDAIIARAKAFLHFVYSKLPQRMSNIASMSAAVSMDTIPGFFYDSALCVVYPEQNANVPVDLRTGRCVEVEEEVHQMVGAVMRGDEDPLMADLLSRYAALTGKTAVELCSFSTDYDVYLSLYRLQHTNDVTALLREWYAVNAHLTRRHGLSVEDVQTVMAGVDAYVLGKLRSQLVQVETVLCERERSGLVKDALMLRSFLWEKALWTGEENWQVLREIIPLVEKLDAANLFTEFLQPCGVKDDKQDARAAELLLKIMMRYGLNQEISEGCLKALVRASDFIRQCEGMRQAMVQFLLEDHRRNVTRRPFMAPLTSRFLNNEDILKQELQLMRENLAEGLPADDQCMMVREYWKQVADRQACDRQLRDFMVDAFRRCGDAEQLDALLQKVYVISVEPAGSSASGTQNRTKPTLVVDMTSSLCAILAASAENRVMLHPAQVTALFGGQGKMGLTRFCSSAQRVREAWMDYVQPTIAAAAPETEMYGWLSTVQKIAENAFASQPKLQQDLERWGEKNCLQVILRRSEGGTRLPTADAFAFILEQAQKGSDLYRAHEAEIKGMYELLMAGEHSAETLPHAIAMLHLFYGTKGYPTLRALAISCTQEKLQAAWSQRGFWKGVEESRTELDALGLTEEEILSETIAAAGKKRLEGELKSISTVGAFRQGYGRYVERKDKTLFYPLWEEMLRRAFVARVTDMFTACQHMQDVAVLCEAVRRLGVEKEAGLTDGGRCIRVLNMSNQTLMNLIDPKQNGAARSYIMGEAGKVMGWLMDRLLQNISCVSHISTLLRTEYCELRREDVAKAGYLVRLCVGMICALNTTTRVIDWQLVLDILCPGNINMMEKPYATANLPLLQCLTALLYTVAAMYQQIRTPEEWLDSLYQFLHDDRTWSAYTNAVKDDRKQLAAYLPNYKDDALLARWIHNRG